MATPAPAGIGGARRIRVFIDYWNFQLALNEREAAERHVELALARFKVDWVRLGPWLSERAAATVGLGTGGWAFEGCHIYSSFNPVTDEGKKYRQWALGWLNRQPGVIVECRERRPKAPPRCPACHQRIDDCPHCTKRIVATEEKGVDTLIATDMIRLAWEGAYDIAVLATSDSDLVPAVAFLGLKGTKVVQAGFPPLGVHLATACWASFDVAPDRQQIARP